MQRQSGFIQRNTTFLKLGVLGILITCIGLFSNPAAQAQMTGNCAGCHTMHNSQQGQSMTFDQNPAPNDNLTRGTCLGCHTQAGSAAIVTQGTGRIPQVYHNDGSTDLVGGNFAYITGFKGGGASDRKGHNIAELTGTDTILYGPPGDIVQSFHDTGYVINTDILTCAGTNGCHGYRYAASVFPDGISGAYHKNEGGALNLANEPANSFRFLMGVKGVEDVDREASVSSGTHNEYYGIQTPV